jgi:hypothetical protein
MDELVLCVFCGITSRDGDLWWQFCTKHSEDCRDHAFGPAKVGPATSASRITYCSSEWLAPQCCPGENSTLCYLWGANVSKFAHNKRH